MAPDLKTVEDLKKYPELFKDPENPDKARIYGAIPGWMIDEVMHRKYLFYGLNESFNYFRCGSESVLFASLASAYNLGDPWVGYCYEPTWVTGKLDLILLGDAPYDPELFQDGKCEIPKQLLRIVSSNKFASRAPDLLDFFSKYNTGSKKVSEALAYLDETNASHKDAAIWFLKNNDSLLDEWLTPPQVDRVRQALASN
jgi:glycine betaine/proline transport system permease protein/glycine betaine/proline transport system substrate-binding protein